MNPSLQQLEVDTTSLTQIFRCHTQIPCAFMVMDVCCSVKKNVKFNHVCWGQMPHAVCRWCSCVVVSVCELRSPSMSDFLEGLENSGWLKHIKAVLDAAIFIAKVSLGVNPRCLPHHCLQYWLRCVSECVWNQVMRYGKTVCLQCFLCAILLDLNEGDKIIQNLQHDGNFNTQ